MRISIVGTGYVGLVTGACLAEKGHRVVCVDVDVARVDALNRAEAPIFEAGLPELLAKHVGRNLSATTDLALAVRESEMTLIAVGTPFDGREIDLSFVLGAARQIGEALRTKSDWHLVVVKSTVVPGTTDGRVLPELERASGKRAGRDFGVGMNPEFLSEGEAVQDFLFPDRIVLGGIDERSTDVRGEVYAPFAPEIPRLRTNPRTAEMIKYASNALLATLISFTNELANLGAALGGIDTVDVMRGVHLSQYMRGRNAEGLPPITSFLKAGCGFGGSCFPKDVKALVAHGESKGQPMPILASVLAINEAQPRRTVELLKRHFPDLAGVRTTVLGLAFKPGTNDVRESPAFPVLQALLDQKADVTAFDPIARREAEAAFPARAGLRYAASLDAAIAGAEAVIVVTPWPDFEGVPGRLGENVVFVDARRAFDKHAIANYEGIGL
ncbi:MAG: UDP-glucose/GDP-mannose dehydrogenase family protein [Deltaproteobacteria bacterium]|nr:UDP-glucose/GDP-mannose dehydrogenase family protein [Deltaproteobacteria bacterium]